MSFMTLPLSMVLCLSAAALGAPDAEHTLSADAVELVRGGDVEGRAEWFVDHEGYRYLFASEENRAAFLADPEKHEIQLGGACARMGPLSGRGRTTIYAEHAGKVYIFASEPCRKTFMANADRFLEADDAKPVTTPAEEAAGWKVVEAAVRGVGGAERLDGARTYLERREREVESQAGKSHVTATLVLEFPARIARMDTWDDHAWGHVVTEADAWGWSSDGEETMSSDQRRALERIGRRELVSLLRARTSVDFVARALGSDEVGGVAVEKVATWSEGVGATLWVDMTTGRTLRVEYVGRGPRMTMGAVSETYTDFVGTGGLTLPSRVETSFDGEAWSERSGPIKRIEVDGAIDPGLWSRKEVPPA